jgi:glycosyltransferase involved in cell wall biosynthesis
VRNGIAKDVFRSPERVLPARSRQPLRIVIEGSRALAHKGVDEALAAVQLMREPRVVTLVSPHRADEHIPGADRVASGLSHPEMAALLRRQHVMLKLSRVEGMYGPPLEAFHMGATVVTTPVTGYDEYIRHGWNGLVVGWDDQHGAARALDLLARDRRLLHHLRHNALQTARSWPSWEQSSQVMALALRAIRAQPPPGVRGAGLRLTSDFLGQMSEHERQRQVREIRAALLEDLWSQKAWHYALAARRRYHQILGPLRRLRRRASS